MIVRHRTQYFPLGGGEIGPTAPGIEATGTAYAEEGGNGTYRGGAGDIAAGGAVGAAAAPGAGREAGGGVASA
jgi:hypothetical protein